MSWAVEPARRGHLAPDSSEQVPVVPGVPIANPIVMVDGGPAATSVTLTVPPVVTVKL